MKSLKALILSCEHPGCDVTVGKVNDKKRYMKTGDYAETWFFLELLHDTDYKIPFYLAFEVWRERVALLGVKTIGQAIADGDIRFDENGKEIIEVKKS